MVLTPCQARSFYDQFGSRQDAQSFYEDAALDDMIAHGDFEHASNVFEFGCGTGRLALHLLTKYLPPSAIYTGTDISETMTGITGKRLAPYSDRIKIIRSEGSIKFPLPDGSVDRVISTYVLDLLSETDIREAIQEAARVLIPDGVLCLVSLTNGPTLLSSVVSVLWSVIFKIRAPWVGGCRPIKLETFIDTDSWSVDYRNVITQVGVPSEILIARKLKTENNSS